MSKSVLLGLLSFLRPDWITLIYTRSTLHSQLASRRKGNTEIMESLLSMGHRKTMAQIMTFEMNIIRTYGCCIYWIYYCIEIQLLSRGFNWTRLQELFRLVMWLYGVVTLVLNVLLWRSVVWHPLKIIATLVYQSEHRFKKTMWIFWIYWKSWKWVHSYFS